MENRQNSALSPIKRVFCHFWPFWEIQKSRSDFETHFFDRFHGLPYNVKQIKNLSKKGGLKNVQKTLIFRISKILEGGPLLKTKILTQNPVFLTLLSLIYVKLRFLHRKRLFDRVDQVKLSAWESSFILRSWKWLKILGRFWENLKTYTFFEKSALFLRIERFFQTP